MYDTVFFKIGQNEAGNSDLLSEIPCYLDRVCIHNYEGVPFISGSVGNMRVTASQHQIKVKDGSLCKFLFGDNYKTMRRHDVQQAVEKLSDSLHLPMERATVTRLDFGLNLILQHPVGVYFNHLGLLNHADRLLQPSGLYYNCGSAQLCLYDKNREQKAHGEKIPAIYQGQNVLRYEQRYLKRLPQRLNRPEITGATLYDDVFFDELLERWRGSYKSIEKVNDVNINFEKMKSVKQTLLGAFATVIEQQGGELAVISQINESCQMGKLTKKQAHDLRLTVRRACSLRDGITAPNEAIQELNNKIDQAARMYR